MKRVLMLAMALALATTAATTQTTVDRESAPMDRLRPLVGRWEGEGWQSHGPDAKQVFRSVETIEQRLDGELLIVEGTHHDKETNELVHHAVAVITWNQDAGKYRFDSHLKDGQHGNYEAEMQGDSFVWKLALPDGGVIRYTIALDGDRWNEVGEYSRDETTWHEFFGMTLHRVPR